MARGQPLAVPTVALSPGRDPSGAVRTGKGLGVQVKHKYKEGLIQIPLLNLYYLELCHAWSQSLQEQEEHDVAGRHG